MDDGSSYGAFHSRGNASVHGDAEDLLMENMPPLQSQIQHGAVRQTNVADNSALLSSGGRSLDSGSSTVHSRLLTQPVDARVMTSASGQSHFEAAAAAAASLRSRTAVASNVSTSSNQGVHVPSSAVSVGMPSSSGSGSGTSLRRPQTGSAPRPPQAATGSGGRAATGPLLGATKPTGRHGPSSPAASGRPAPVVPSGGFSRSNSVDDPDSLEADTSVKQSMKYLPRWLSVHRQLGPCKKCYMCLQTAPWQPRQYTHPKQWSSPQLQGLAADKGVQPNQCVCRNCMLQLMGVLATPARLAASDRRSEASPTSPAENSARTSATSVVNGRSGAGANPRRTSSAPKRKRNTEPARGLSDVESSDSSPDVSDDDRTYHVKKSHKRQPPAAPHISCAYPKCPEVARHHIGQRSHPAAATLLSLSWDVIKASCDSSGRLPLCNEHHQTVNQLNGPCGKRYQSKSSVRDLVSDQFRPEDYGPAFTVPTSSSASNTVSRRSRRWKAVDTNTPFARALRSLPKVSDRPERTYCGLVRMPVTCLLPSSHDMALDRTVKHAVPSDVAVTSRSSPASADPLLRQRLFKRRLFGCTPVDAVTGEALPQVQLMYPGQAPPPVDTGVKATKPPRPTSAPTLPNQQQLQQQQQTQRHMSQPVRPSGSSAMSSGSMPSAPHLIASSSSRHPTPSPGPPSHPHSRAIRPMQAGHPGMAAHPMARPGPPRPNHATSQSLSTQGRPQPRATHAAGWSASSHPGPPPRAVQPRPAAPVPRGPQPHGRGPVLLPANQSHGASAPGETVPYFQVNGICEHLNIPPHLTDLDIQKQEEKVLELHRKLQQATAR